MVVSMKTGFGIVSDVVVVSVPVSCLPSFSSVWSNNSRNVYLVMVSLLVGNHMRSKQDWSDSSCSVVELEPLSFVSW